MTSDLEKRVLAAKLAGVKPKLWWQDKDGQSWISDMDTYERWQTMEQQLFIATDKNDLGRLLAIDQIQRYQDKIQELFKVSMAAIINGEELSMHLGIMNLEDL